MTSRPFDSSGDILPVLSRSNLLTGPEALSAALNDHLHLYTGDWWENPSKGNGILDLLADSRRTSGDAAALRTCLFAYILGFPGVASVTKASGSFSNHTFHFTCTAHTEDGITTDVSMTC